MTAMNIKKKRADRAKANPASEFVGEVKAEIGRISWTSKEELRVYTKIVVAAAFMMGMATYGTDVMLRTFIDGLELFVQMVVG